MSQGVCDMVAPVHARLPQCKRVMRVKGPLAISSWHRNLHYTGKLRELKVASLATTPPPTYNTGRFALPIKAAASRILTGRCPYRWVDRS